MKRHAEHIRLSLLGCEFSPEEADALIQQIRISTRQRHAPNHTCIKDDGGTPNRRCDACDKEKHFTASEWDALEGFMNSGDRR